MAKNDFATFSVPLLLILMFSSFLLLIIFGKMFVHEFREFFTKIHITILAALKGEL